MRRSEIVTIDNYRYATMILLIVSVISVFFGLINVNGYGISLLRAMLPSGIDTSILSPDSIWLFDKFIILGIAYIVLPFIESAVMVFAKDVYALITGCASLVLNVIVGAFIIKKSLSCVEMLGVFGYDAKLSPLPVIIWVLLYVLILAATAVILWQTFRNDTEEPVFKEEENVIIDDIHDYRKDTRSKWDFCGAILCQKGLFRGKAFALNANEKVAFGSAPEDEIQLAKVPEGRTFCYVSYDTSKGEYQVEPLVNRSVFLESGQPLGKGRVYCIPRDFVLIVVNGDNRFKLA